VAGWIWRLYHATEDGRLFNYPVHLSRKWQLCLDAPHVGKETLQIQDAGRFPLHFRTPSGVLPCVSRQWPSLIPKIRCLGYVLSYSVGYKAMVHRAFSEQRKACI
jgi:hypothetical protein